jgi:hypothetical protein
LSMGFYCSDTSDDPLPSRRGFCFSAIITFASDQTVKNAGRAGRSPDRDQLRRTEMAVSIRKKRYSTA